MSYGANYLRTQDLSATMPRVSLNERARQRLKDQKAQRHLSERDLMSFLNWSQSKVAQKLGGRTPITLDELESLCAALSISPTEVVRDQGLEFCADMTPSELRLLHVVRERKAVDSLLYLLGVTSAQVESRGVTKSREGRINKMR